MEKQQKLIELLKAKGVELTPEELEALDRCFGKRGKYKGYLTRTAPNSFKFPLANVIYNAITPNPYKMQIFNMLVTRVEYRETYNKLGRFDYPAWLDLDREQLQQMGAW
jgi:hypothetical protein